MKTAAKKPVVGYVILLSWTQASDNLLMCRLQHHYSLRRFNTKRQVNNFLYNISVTCTGECQRSLTNTEVFCALITYSPYGVKEQLQNTDKHKISTSLFLLKQRLAQYQYDSYIDWWLKPFIKGQTRRLLILLSLIVILLCAFEMKATSSDRLNKIF